MIIQQIEMRRHKEQDKIDFLLLQRNTAKQIREITGLSRDIVCRLIRSSNLKPRMKPNNLIYYKDVILTLKEVGFTFSQIEKTLNLKKNQVRNFYYTNNIKYKTSIKQYRNKLSISIDDFYRDIYNVSTIDKKYRKEIHKWNAVMNDIYLAILIMMLQTGKSYYSKALGEFAIKRTKFKSIRLPYRKLSTIKKRIFKEEGRKADYYECSKTDVREGEIITVPSVEYKWKIVWYKKHKAFRFRNVWKVRMQSSLYLEICKFLNSSKNRKYLHKIKSQ